MRVLRAAAVLWLLSAAVGATARAQAPADPVADKAAVLAGIRKRIEATDFRATGRLVRVGGDGKRTSYKLTMKGHWFPDGLSILCEITEPVASRVRLLLHMTATGRTTIELAKPGSPVSALPFEKWNDGLLGTDFSYEDLVEGQFFWKPQEMRGPEKYGARDCFVLTSTPGAEDRSHYGTVVSWIDQKILYPVHMVKTVRGGAVQKDFTYYGLRQSSGVWSATQIEVKVLGKPGSSLLVIEQGSEVAKLGRGDFDLDRPAHGED